MNTINWWVIFDILSILSIHNYTNTTPITTEGEGKWRWKREEWRGERSEREEERKKERREEKRERDSKNVWMLDIKLFIWYFSKKKKIIVPLLSFISIFISSLFSSFHILSFFYSWYFFISVCFFSSIIFERSEVNELFIS